LISVCIKMGIRRYYIDVIEARKRGLLAIILKLCLVVPSCFYWSVVVIRNFLYDRNIILKQAGSGMPVISIGNLTWGGTGKTSMAIFLSRALSPKKTAVLTRGYADDEVALLRDYLSGTGADVYTGRDRAKILEAISFDHDLAILDDGFQHRRIKRDLDILLINGVKPFGPGFLLPLGILREPKAGIKRAGLAVIMHSADKALENTLKAINPGIEVFYGRYEVNNLLNLQGEAYPKDSFINKPLACFCAIGYPEGFISSLGSIGLKPRLKFIYPDHQALGEGEFRKIEERCLSSGIQDLIITAKDRLRFGFPTKLSIFILAVCLKIEREDLFLGLVKNVLANKNGK